MNIPYISHEDHPDSFKDLLGDEQETVLRWIRANIKHRRTVSDWTSYGLKHELERDTGLYITNGAFKGGMLQCGFGPVDLDALNWTFRISTPR